MIEDYKIGDMIVFTGPIGELKGLRGKITSIGCNRSIYFETETTTNGDRVMLDEFKSVWAHCSEVDFAPPEGDSSEEL